MVTAARLKELVDSYVSHGCSTHGEYTTLVLALRIAGDVFADYPTPRSEEPSLDDIYLEEQSLTDDVFFALKDFRHLDEIHRDTALDVAQQLLHRLSLRLPKTDGHPAAARDAVSMMLTPLKSRNSFQPSEVLVNARSLSEQIAYSYAYEFYRSMAEPRWSPTDILGAEIPGSRVPGSVAALTGALVYGYMALAQTGQGVLFISYSRQDRTYVDELCGHLRSQHIAVWLDRSDMDYGTTWEQELDRRLVDCAALLVVMSPASKCSPWVAHEIDRAKSLEKRIYPLLLDGERFTDLNHLQEADVRGGQMPIDHFVERVRRFLLS